MVKIAQIDDRGATTAWSPVRSHAEVIALGAKVSNIISFEKRSNYRKCNSPLTSLMYCRIRVVVALMILEENWNYTI
jgi:hypothetical protein